MQGKTRGIKETRSREVEKRVQQETTGVIVSSAGVHGSTVSKAGTFGGRLCSRSRKPM